MNAVVEPDADPRQTVVCCDGTNNTLTAGLEDTNVLRLYSHLAGNAPSNRLSTTTPASELPTLSRPPTRSTGSSARASASPGLHRGEACTTTSPRLIVF